ncbi:MAG: hypothetical protein LBL91_02440 [Lachnospiraceae bacterium]|jgi:hypothetical protein|nr:hypothetical protein [Lachnospiraceae bacterium]
MGLVDRFMGFFNRRRQKALPEGTNKDENVLYEDKPTNVNPSNVEQTVIEEINPAQKFRKKLSNDTIMCIDSKLPKVPFITFNPDKAFRGTKSESFYYDSAIEEESNSFESVVQARKFGNNGIMFEINQDENYVCVGSLKDDMASDSNVVTRDIRNLMDICLKKVVRENIYDEKSRENSLNELKKYIDLTSEGEAILSAGGPIKVHRSCVREENVDGEVEYKKDDSLQVLMFYDVESYNNHILSNKEGKVNTGIDYKCSMQKLFSEQNLKEFSVETEMKKWIEFVDLATESGIIDRPMDTEMKQRRAVYAIRNSLVNKTIEERKEEFKELLEKAGHSTDIKNIGLDATIKKVVIENGIHLENMVEAYKNILHKEGKENGYESFILEKTLAFAKEEMHKSLEEAEKRKDPEYLISFMLQQKVEKANNSDTER